MSVFAENQYFTRAEVNERAVIVSLYTVWIFIEMLAVNIHNPFNFFTSILRQKERQG